MEVVGWEVRLDVCMLVFVHVRERERKRLGVRDEGGKGEGLCLSICSICGETRRCKKKVSKRSSKLTDKQTSGTNSSNTDVQVQKEN